MTKETFTTCGEGFYSRTLRKSPAQKLPVQAAADADAPVAQPAAAPADDNSKSRWGWLSPTKLWSAQPVASDVAAEGDRDGASAGPVAAAPAEAAAVRAVVAVRRERGLQHGFHGRIGGREGHGEAPAPLREALAAIQSSGK